MLALRSTTIRQLQYATNISARRFYSASTLSMEADSAVMPFIAPTIAAVWQQRSVSVLEGLRGLWESILRAVPKKKTSHSKKRMRSANKGLKNRTDIVACPGCGRDRMMGHVCRHCLRDIRHRLKYGENTPSTAVA